MAPPVGDDKQTRAEAVHLLLGWRGQWAQHCFEDWALLRSCFLVELDFCWEALVLRKPFLCCLSAVGDED